MAESDSESLPVECLSDIGDHGVEISMDVASNPSDEQLELLPLTDTSGLVPTAWRCQSDTQVVGDGDDAVSVAGISSCDSCISMASGMTSSEELPLQCPAATSSLPKPSPLSQSSLENAMGWGKACCACGCILKTVLDRVPP